MTAVISMAPAGQIGVQTLMLTSEFNAPTPKYATTAQYKIVDVIMFMASYRVVHVDDDTCTPHASYSQISLRIKGLED